MGWRMASKAVFIAAFAVLSLMADGSGSCSPGAEGEFIEAGLIGLTGEGTY
jgi:hypothetical protein